MPSPFPGMDPFIEAQEWDDFHTTFNTVMREVLTPALRHRYFVRVERRIYVEHPSDDSGDAPLRYGDVAIVAGPSGRRVGPTETTTTSGATILPQTCTLSISEERRESYLVVRDRDDHKVVTVIETLSPSNKRRGGDGWTEYLEKRDQILRSQSHFVEIDLLRGGDRMPMQLARPPEDGQYYTLVSRAAARPRADIFVWGILQELPTIPIPLLRGDKDVALNLQQVFGAVYDRAAYDRSIDYFAELDPPLPDDTQAWLRERLSESRTRQERS